MSISNLLTDEFCQFVNSMLRIYARRTSADQSPVADSVFSHLTKVVVQIALRDSWNLSDVNLATRRIQEMMFQRDSELVQEARYSELEFVQESDSQEHMLSTGDVDHQLPSGDHLASRIAEEFAGLVDSDHYASYGKHCLFEAI